MASLPQRPASQRRVSPRDEPTSSQHEHQPLHSNSSFSIPSEDSRTVLLNSPRIETRAHELCEQDTTQTTSGKTSNKGPLPDAEPRKCWICFNDETEDDDTTSEWRSPCPCVLVAHEKCLLDWIADMEAPNSRRRAGGRKGKILCPQCRSEIHLQRPRSLVVDTVRIAERLTSHFLLPGVALTLGTATYSTMALIGRAQIYQIFGTQDALEILAPLYQAPDITHDSLAARFLDELRQHWRLHIGLPLVPTVLILSRTTLIDSFLPFLPLIFFVNSGKPHEEMLQISWPPSAAFAIASLPYIRGIYNAYYDRVWLPRERRWLKEIQPRTDSEPEAGDLEIDIGPAMDDDENDEGDIAEDAIEVQVNFDIFADWNNGGEADNNQADENPPVPIARGPGPPMEPPPEDDTAGEMHPHIEDAPAPAPNVPQARPEAQQQPQRPRVRRERNIAFSTTNLADIILGALVFPSIAAAVGEALRFALPKSWVTPPLSGKPTGFLQARWGRSILGGCMFVGVKDAVMLYVRWKMAQNHRKRRVLDYDRSKEKRKKKSDRT